MAPTTKMTEADAAAGGGSPAKKDEKPLSKRQRRKQTSTKHLLPQMPKIVSSEARAKAYVRAAGLSQTSTKKQKQLNPDLDLDSPEFKFGRLLGSADQRVRHSAVLQLERYLTLRCDIATAKGLSELDLLKLWKALWYTLYMADRVPVQDELSSRIAGLLWCVAGTEEEDECAGQAYMDLCLGEEEEEVDEEVEEEDPGYAAFLAQKFRHLPSDEDFDEENAPDFFMEEVANTLDDAGDSGDDQNASSSDEEDQGSDQEAGDTEDTDDPMLVPHCRGAHLAAMFVRTFFRTIRREWGRMDKYRIDKFYTLMRLMMYQVYKYMAVRHWNVGIIRLFNDALFDEVLSQTPNGLRYHLIDIALDELAKVNANEAGLPLTEATFLDCLEPFFAMAQTGAGGDDTIQQRVVENVLTKFLDCYSVLSENAHGGDEDHSILDQVHVGTVAQFIFDVASDESCTNDQYRKSLYDLHKMYARRLKEVGRDVELNHGSDDDEETPPELDSSMDDLKVEVNDAEEDADAEQETKQAKKSKKDKKKKKKDKKKKRKRDSEATLEPPKATAGKPTLADFLDDATRETLFASEDTPEETDKGRKKKKKKHKKGKAVDSAAPSSSNPSKEETVTISLSEQRTARSMFEESRDGSDEMPVLKKRRKTGPSNATNEDGSRRVKFNTKNKTRSWKASMSGLRQMDTPPTPDPTPEKSILRKHLTEKQKKSLARRAKKDRRKRAMDYF